jgi:PAS domain S-box-containing protein
MNKRVLLVDDEPAIVAALSRTLRNRGYDVVGAHCSSEAFRLMEVSPAAVVISDYQMPCMRGTELLGRLEARWPETIRIILSGYADYNTVMEAIESGVVHKFLAKPWNNNELLEQLEEAFTFYDGLSVDTPTPTPSEKRPVSNTIVTDRLTPEAVQLQTMLDTVVDGIATVDNHGVMLSVNKAFDRIFGYNTAELVGNHLAKLVPSQPEDKPNCVKSDLLKDITGVPRNIAGLRKNGEAFPMELSVTPMQILGQERFLVVIRDTSRRVAAERQNQLLLKSLDSCQDGYALFGPGDRLLYCNQQFRQLYHSCATGPVKGATYEEFFQDCINSGLFPAADDDPKYWLDELLEAHDTLPMVRVEEISPGRWIQIHETRADNGSLIVFHIDISQLKIAENSLRDAVGRAVDANEAKSRFLAMMSHEIRTPLNGVLGLLQLLQEENLSGEQQEYVETALVSGRSLLTIISDILDFSKMEAGKMELHPAPCHLASLTKELKQLLSPRVEEKSIQLIISIDPAVPEYVRVDHQRLRQVLLNLLGNAIKFTDYGEVSLHVVRQSDGRIRFAVDDTGIGIPDDQQNRVFGEFNSGLSPTDNKVHEGTGLGLAISRHLIDLMDGELQFSSQDQQGSHFWFSLQLEHTCAPMAQHTKQQSGKLSFRGSILLVEDSATNRLVAKTMLEKSGLSVTCAEDGYRALELCQSRCFDLVLMDISMPGIDGLETTARILQLPNWNLAPIIALTAYAMPGDRECFLKQGMSDYVEKPIDKQRLLKVVGRYVQTEKVSEPEQSDPNSVSLMEPERLKRLAEDTSYDMVPELAQVFLDDSGERLQGLSEMTRPFLPEDHAEIERHMHTLGSSAALYGLTVFHDQSRRFERACQAGDYALVEKGLTEFITLGQQSRHTLAEVIKGWSASRV